MGPDEEQSDEQIPDERDEEVEEGSQAEEKQKHI